VCDGAALSAIFVLRCASAQYFHFVVPARPCVLGRSSACDFVVEHASVSRRHARCCVGETGLVITDLGSHNGTFVDGQRIAEARVTRGQALRFGDVSFLVAIEGVAPLTSEDDTDTGNGNGNGGASTALDLPTGECMSEAQQRVFNLLLSGNKEKNIARTLELSPHTVHNHVRAIFRLFDVHSRAELLARLLDRAPPAG
jgi:DNA-binding CsgD family transcriptional regulator